MPKFFLAVVFFVASTTEAWCAPVLPTLFSDHMVLQQGREIRVWGKAEAGEKIAVTLAGASATAITDSSGRWNVPLPTRAAGGPFTLSIRGQREITIRDVMIGEVWIASGQSNMAFALEGAEGAANEIAQAADAQLRLFTVPKRIALSPQDDTLPAHWELCTPDSAKGFSAVAYFFAREIRHRLNVPVGIVESVWPGTTIEEWIAPEFLQGDPELKPLVDRWNQVSPAEQSFAEHPLAYELEFDDFELIPAAANSDPKMLANFKNGTSSLATGGAFSYSWNEAGDSVFELISPGRGGGFAARVAGHLDGTQDSILSASYKSDGSPLDLTSYAGIRFWVRGHGSFRFRSKQSTITDYDDYATKLIKVTAEWEPVTILFRNLRQDGWGVYKEFTQSALTGFSIEDLTSVGYAEMPVSGLYEGMIAPLTPYSFRGALWYQGESNALRAHQYRKLLPTLIRNWREATQQNDLEFLIVQLPNHGAIREEPTDSAWAELREAQLMTLRQLPHTGLAVTIDVGDPHDLHPHRKREVGQRLALWALGTVYKQNIEYSGPLYDSVQISGADARVHFSHADGGLVTHGENVVHGFALAGADHKFRWAAGRIEGDAVVVTSPAVGHPVAVRYAWGDSPMCDLYNKEGLPASPFRSDDWSGITDAPQTNH